MRYQRCVLLAEDDLTDVALMSLAWGKSSVTVPLCVVRDGQEAMDYLAGREQYQDRQRYPFPSLVLLDLKMPRVNGFEVLDWLQQHARLRRVPVVVLSGSDDRGDLNRAYDLGANSYLVKPSAFEELHVLVDRVKAYWVELNHGPDQPED
jgi:CheY-like chemotaxis protein